MARTFQQIEPHDISPIINTVFDLLSQKALFEALSQDKNNITKLGGVNFHFMERDGEYFLMYDVHPSLWNENAIRNDIEDYSKYMARAKGVFIE